MKIDLAALLAVLGASLLILMLFVAVLGLASGIFYWTIALGAALVIIAFLVESGIV